MRLIRRFVIVPVLLASFVLSGCNVLGFRSWSWQQKLTLTVTTPSGDVSGSSIASITFGADPKWWTVGFMKLASGHSFSGEATVVEIAPGHYLIALLKNYGYETALRAFAGDGMKGISEDGVHRLLDRLATQKERHEVPRLAYPVLVTFKDINNPLSVREVRPEDLASHFGDGIKLASITIETTDQPSTNGIIRNILKWLPDYYGKRLDGNRFTTINSSNRFANQLSTGDFISK